MIPEARALGPMPNAIRIARDESCLPSASAHADTTTAASSVASAGLQRGLHAARIDPFFSTEETGRQSVLRVPPFPIIPSVPVVPYCRFVGSMSSTIQGQEWRGVLLVSAFLMTVIFMLLSCEK